MEEKRKGKNLNKENEAWEDRREVFLKELEEEATAWRAWAVPRWSLEVPLHFQEIEEKVNYIFEHYELPKSELSEKKEDFFKDFKKKHEEWLRSREDYATVCKEQELWSDDLFDDRARYVVSERDVIDFLAALEESLQEALFRALQSRLPKLTPTEEAPLPELSILNCTRCRTAFRPFKRERSLMWQIGRLADAVEFYGGPSFTEVYLFTLEELRKDEKKLQTRLCERCWRWQGSSALPFLKVLSEHLRCFAQPTSSNENRLDLSAILGEGGLPKRGTSTGALYNAHMLGDWDGMESFSWLPSLKGSAYWKTLLEKDSTIKGGFLNYSLDH